MLPNNSIIWPHTSSPKVWIYQSKISPSAHFPCMHYFISCLMTLVWWPSSEKSCSSFHSICSVMCTFALGRCIPAILVQQKPLVGILWNAHLSYTNTIWGVDISNNIFPVKLILILHFYPTRRKKKNRNFLHRSFNLSGRSGDRSKHIKILFSLPSVCCRWPPLILNIFLYL